MNNTTRLPQGNPTFNPFSGLNESPLAYRVVTGVIGVITILANTMLITVLLKLRGMLIKPYNILILNLALTDVLTGILFFITPDMVIPRENFPPFVNKDGYCHLIGSQFFVMVFGKASILTVSCLALNRWFLVIYPMKYRVSFTRKKVCIFIAMIWVVALIVTPGRPLVMSTNRGTKCSPIRPHPWPRTTHLTVTIVYIFVTFFIPMTTSWLMFAHIFCRIRKKTLNKGGRTDQAKMALLRMCVLTALVMTVCWEPSVIFHLVALNLKSDVLDRELRFRLHNITKVIGLFNSCVNPFIYCFSNRTYREKFIQVLSPIFWSSREEEEREEVSMSDQGPVQRVICTGEELT